MPDDDYGVRSLYPYYGYLGDCVGGAPSGDGANGAACVDY